VALTGPASAGSWQVHAVLRRSTANGPGMRFVIWTQGCSLGCAGCFNPETHASGADEPSRIADVVEEVLATEGIEGITITGGEPLEQHEQLREFCEEIRRRSDLGLILLTGFSRAEIEGVPARLAAVASVDMAVAGRYNARLHLGRGLRGSSNKEYWPITSRYTAADFSSVPESEIVIAPDGTVSITGMHPWQEEN
jgi:anaerobic ribonucleoside-triphosphate reductase activating protein